MTIFYNAICALQSTLESSIFARWAVPRRLAAQLAEFDANKKDDALECAIVKTFFSINQDDRYYRFLGKKLTCLKAFKRSIGKAINNHLAYASNQNSEESERRIDEISENEVLLSGYYYLLKSKLYTAANQACFNTHHAPYTVLKSMRILYRHKLLTQPHLHFIATPQSKADKALDILDLLFTLEFKDWLTRDILEKIIHTYQIGLGELMFMLANAEEEGKPRLMQFSKNIFNKILSLSQYDREKLKKEFRMLIQFSDYIEIDPPFLDVLISGVQDKQFESLEPLLRLLKGKEALNTSILFILYSQSNLEIDKISPTLKYLLSIVPKARKQQTVEYYFKHGAPNLTKYFVKYGEYNKFWLIDVLIHEKSRQIIQSMEISHQNLLTESLICQLKNDAFVSVMQWFLENEKNLPTSYFNDSDLIELSQLNYAPQLMELFNTIEHPSFHLFHLLTQKCPRKYVMEIFSIAPQLKEANLMKENILQELLLHLQKQPMTRGVSAIILVIRALPDLNPEKWRQLIRHEKNEDSSCASLYPASLIR